MANKGVSIVLVILLSSCLWLEDQDFFVFSNNADYTIYALVDLHSCDGKISKGSCCCRVRPHAHKYVGTFDDNKHWYEEVKDSAHVYVLDASMIDLSIGVLSEEDIEGILDEMILSRITILHSVTKNHFSVLFPENKVVEGWISDQ